MLSSSMMHLRDQEHHPDVKGVQSAGIASTLSSLVRGRYVLRTTSPLRRSKTFGYLTRGTAWASALSADPRTTLRAIHPPPTSASNAPTTGPATDKGPKTNNGA